MCKETSRIRRSRSSATASANSVQVTPQMCVNPSANPWMGRRLWTTARAWGLVVLLASWGLYLVTLAPGVFWLDSGELVASAHTLGIPHPPGHPVYLILAKLASLVPIASVPVRVGLLSAVFGSAVALLLYALVLWVWRGRDDSCDLLLAPSAALGALVFTASPALWFQSIRSEVYTLNLALILIPTLLLVRLHGATPAPAACKKRNGQALGAGNVAVAVFLVGLGLGNHHLLVLLSLPALAWLALSLPSFRARLTLGRFALLFMVGVVALAPYAVLPLRARLLPAMHWGDASTLAGFFDLVSARVFHGAVDPATRASLGANLLVALELFMRQLTAPVVLAGVVGLVLLARRRPLPAVGLLLLLFGSLLSKVMMFLDPDNPDDHGYFSAALGMLALAAAVAVGAAAAALARRWPAAKGALALGCGALALGAMTVQVTRNVESSSLMRFRSPDVVLDATLEGVPPRTVLMPYYYALHFTLQYAQLVEERRPDVALVHQTFMAHIDGGEPYLRRLETAHPRLGNLAEAFRREAAVPTKAVLAQSKERPVYLEPFRERVVPAENLEPLGMLARVRFDPAALPQAGSEAERAQSAWRVAYWTELERRLGHERVRYPHTGALLLWYTYLEAHLLYERGEYEAAREAVRRGLSWHPDSPRLRRLETRLLTTEGRACIEGGARGEPLVRSFVDAAAVHGKAKLAWPIRRLTSKPPNRPS